MLEKLNYRGTVCCLQTRYFNVMYFPHNCIHTVFHIFLVKQTEETRSKKLPGYRHYQYKYTFYSQEHMSLRHKQPHTQNKTQIKKQQMVKFRLLN